VPIELGPSGEERLTRAELFGLWGTMPEPAPLDVRVEDVVHADGLLRERLTFQAEPGERIRVPTTVLWPEEDPLFPVQWSDRLDAFFDSWTLRTLPRIGHFLPVEAPGAVAEAILDAVAG